MSLFDRDIRVIQGGMGVAVSDWRLARAVSQHGAMGVVSGTALDAVLVRRLQLGDTEGHLRRALSRFPWPEMAERVLTEYWIPGGKAQDAPFKLGPMPSWPPTRQARELLVVANFVEVMLAKEGHDGPIGINYLEKIQLPTLPSLLGAMLAGVDAILMGGGIPLSIPGILEGLARWEPVRLNVTVEGRREPLVDQLDPAELLPGTPPVLERPIFLGIVSSDVVAKALLRRASGRVDGFIVENHTAGGHNAPPRRDRSRAAEMPSYGPKDVPDLEKVRALERPFWLAGGYASPEGLQEALDAGACGIQVGTPFAYCRESAIRPEIKRSALEQALNGGLVSETAFAASPTGYPFKVVNLSREPEDAAASRKPLCDLGYLRTLYVNERDQIAYRCPAEPLPAYLAKGGERADTVGKRCLCNGLMATVGLGQVRADGVEPPILTSGEDFGFVKHLVDGESTDYTAKDVLDYLRG